MTLNCPYCGGPVGRRILNIEDQEKYGDVPVLSPHWVCPKCQKEVFPS